MKYEISGTTMQTLSINLAPGESVFAQTDGMAWKTETIIGGPLGGILGSD